MSNDRDRNSGLSYEDLDAIKAVCRTFEARRNSRNDTDVEDVDADFVPERTMSITRTGSIELSESLRASSSKFSKSIEPPTSNSFYYGDNTPQNKKPTGERLLTANIRSAYSSLAKKVECITSSLTDEYEESFGRSSNQCIDDLTYELSNVTFNPKGCSWDADVKVNSLVVEKSITNKQIQVELNSECTLHVVCTAVVVNEDDKIGEDLRKVDIDASTKAYDDYLMNKHFSIDLLIAPKETVKNHRLQRSISDTVIRISQDITKQLFKQKLPEFEEGCKGESFRKIYQLNTKLKSGSFATVCAGTHRATGQKFAIKCVQRQKMSPLDDVSTLSEVSVLSRLSHPRICSIMDFFIEEKCYFIVMPLMEGGDVFDRIANIKQYNESIARNMVFEMLKAIAYLHENEYAHCDLKPKNLLLRKKDDDSSVMIADFGFARRVFFPKSLTKQCGTPYFVAPEILLKTGYDTSADLWSLGVIIYSILSGCLPFTGRNHIDLFKNIVDGTFVFDSENWDSVSEDAKDLIRKLLTTDPDKRFSATDCLNHAWIRADSRMLRRNALISTSQRMKTFNARMTFKTAILATRSVMRWKNIANSAAAAQASASDNASFPENENIAISAVAAEDSTGDNTFFPEDEKSVES